MRRFHRFVHRKEQAAPLFFFVACFILGTLILVGAFVFFNKRPADVAPITAVVENVPVTESMASVTSLAPVDNDAYFTTVTTALASFIEATKIATGGWVDAPDWEERIREVNRARAVEQAATALEKMLAEMRVPGDARSHHLAIVVAAGDTLAAVRQERWDLLEAALLRIDELYNVVYKK